MVIDVLGIHLDWFWSRKLLWLTTNGSKGLEGEIKTSSLYFSALVKTKASLSHPLCAFPLLDPTWSYLALSGKQKLLPRQKASCLTNQPQGRKESVLLSNVQALRLALNPVFLTYTQSSHWYSWILLIQAYRTLKGKLLTASPLP